MQRYLQFRAPPPPDVDPLRYCDITTLTEPPVVAPYCVGDSLLQMVPGSKNYQRSSSIFLRSVDLSVSIEAGDINVSLLTAEEDPMVLRVGLVLDGHAETTFDVENYFQSVDAGGTRTCTPFSYRNLRANDSSTARVLLNQHISCPAYNIEPLSWMWDPNYGAAGKWSDPNHPFVYEDGQDAMCRFFHIAVNEQIQLTGVGVHGRLWAFCQWERANSIHVVPYRVKMHARMKWDNLHN